MSALKIVTVIITLAFLIGALFLIKYMHTVAARPPCYEYDDVEDVPTQHDDTGMKCESIKTGSKTLHFTCCPY